MTSWEITRSLAFRHFGYQKAILVPRCNFAGWEADLLVLRPSGWLEEVEIKISTSDFRREFQTKADKHMVLVRGSAPLVFTGSVYATTQFDPENPNHVRERDSVGDRFWWRDYTDPKPHMLRRYWFAMPESLAKKHLADIPEHAGLLSIAETGYPDVTVLKDAPKLEHSRKITQQERVRLMRLAYLRYWSVAEREMAEVLA